VRLRDGEGHPDLIAAMPVHGEIARVFATRDAPGVWHLLWLDHVVSIDGAEAAHLLIAPRWVAMPLGGPRPCPVWVRLSTDPPEEPPLALERFPEIGSAIAEVVQE
jgi:hypothetical protein